MNTFTADIAKELTCIKNNGMTDIENFILQQACLGHNFITLSDYEPLFYSAVEHYDKLLDMGFNVYKYCYHADSVNFIDIDWR